MPSLEVLPTKTADAGSVAASNSNFPTLDFNNDSYSDDVEILSNEYIGYGYTDYRGEEWVWPYVAPMLQGQWPLEKFGIIPLFDCQAPEVVHNGKTLKPEEVTSWQLPKSNVFGIWYWPFMRFYNSDRSMFFRAGQKVALRSNPQEQTILKSPIVHFYPKEGIQVGPIHARLPDCEFVLLEDLIWVTKSGEPLDMRQAIALAMSEKSISDGVATSAEIQAAQLIRGAKGIVANAKPDATPETKRDAVVDFVKDKPFAAELPLEWESNLLFALNLPQIQRPEPEPVKSCYELRLEREAKEKDK